MNTLAPLAACVLASVAFAVLLGEAAAAGSVHADDVSNWGQILAAFAGSAGCLVAARRSIGERRRGWAFLAAGTATWGVGQVVWTVYESVLRQPVPFPSAADVGYLLFPVVAGWGLVTWMGLRGHGAARGRDVFDGLIIAGSLLMLSWLTVLGPIARAAGADGWFSLTLSLAYPVGDLVLGTLVLLAFLHVEHEQRRSLWLMVVGLSCIAVADSSFMLLEATSSFSSSDLPSNVGWFVGFLVVGLAGLAAPHAGREQHDTWSDRHQKIAGTIDATLRLSVPYLALVVALGALGVRLLGDPGTPTTAILLAGVLVSMVLLRQLLAMLDNQRLIIDLAEAQRHLEHEATHDPLTGLPNRILFSARLDRALAAPDTVVNLMFCDLDGFKRVNDDHGHDVGDELLKVVADRLLDCVRDTDTVARLGGDEFAVLLHDCSDPDLVAAMILEAIAQDVDAGPVRASVSVSIGRVRHVTGPRDDRDRAHRRELAGSLLKRADGAMYAAKTAGRNQSQVAQDVVVPLVRELDAV
ncbi:diguanylate cyclase domain-containing protein [Solicola sp. PLA-1-18]|uniref:diguanylate cyclase domain-containing protein n=1 Tax=Solicola sp. PLA-1-18 TaxID=3380532 RepID=UPI003B79BDB1